jgi:hypothetical protein
MLETITVRKLQEVLKELVNNGLGDCPVYVRGFGNKEEYRKDIRCIHSVLQGNERYVEIIYEGV